MFYSCLGHFFSSRCMLELRLAIYYRAASLPSQASYAVLAQESLTRPGSRHSAILRNNYITLLSDLCACVHGKKKWRRKGSHSSSVSGSNPLVWLRTWKKAMGRCTAQWKMLLFCAKTIVKASHKFELARLKKETFWRLATFCFGTFAMLFSATGCVFRHENHRRWTVGRYNGL